MRILDMPMDELKKYMGTTPRPADFDEYWEDAVKEMTELPEETEWVEETSFNLPYAKCYHFYFKGIGGVRVHNKCIIPNYDKEKRLPAVIQYHGYSCASPDWVQMMPYAAAGIAIFAQDTRGQGGITGDNSGLIEGDTRAGQIIRGLYDSKEKLYFRSAFLDAVQFAKIIMNMDFIDKKRVGAFGESQGGALSIVCAALEQRIKLIAPTYPFLCDYKRIWELGLDVNVYAELREYFRRKDPLHEREDEAFTKLGYIDIQFFAPYVKAKVLWFCGLLDDVCPPSTQFACYNRIKSEKEMVFYPDFSHEALTFKDDKTFKYFLDNL